MGVAFLVGGRWPRVRPKHHLRGSQQYHRRLTKVKHGVQRCGGIGGNEKRSRGTTMSCLLFSDAWKKLNLRHICFCHRGKGCSELPKHSRYGVKKSVLAVLPVLHTVCGSTLCAWNQRLRCCSDVSCHFFGEGRGYFSTPESRTYYERVAVSAFGGRKLLLRLYIRYKYCSKERKVVEGQGLRRCRGI